jgi:hypothetical protein
MKLRCWVIGYRLLERIAGSHILKRQNIYQSVFPVEDITKLFTKKIRETFPSDGGWGVGGGGRASAHLVVSRVRWVEHVARMTDKK